MKKWIDNNINKLIGIFLLIQPILDLITGICVNTLKIDITFGLIVRMLFLGLMCFISLFIYKKKKLLIPYLVLIIYFILYTIGMIIYKDSSLLIELKNLGRVFYFPVLLVTLFSIKDKIRISPMTLLTVVLLYLLFLFIPTLFGLGYQSYKVTKVGTLGFYNSANELSGIISILTPFIILVFYKSKKLTPILLVSLIYLVVILMIGTKTPLLALMITIGLSLLYIWGRWIEKRNYKLLISTIGIIILGILSLYLVLPRTNFYKNIKTHLDYLGLNNVTDVFKDSFYIDHFIFSSRLEFLSNKSSIYHNSNLYEKLFGIGYINNDKETKLIEMDYYDIYYSHGVIGFILFFSITVYILINVLNDHNNKSYEYLMKFISLFLIVFLSFFTGHILTAPSVSLLVVVIMLSISKRDKKDLLFASYFMDVGGIEKALLNLVNRIDQNKYNITIILEKKRGIFLPQINKGIRVQELKVSNNKNVIIRKLINVIRKELYKIFNYHNYDFSCCYTTYSYSSSKLALMSSDNNAFFIHGDYTIIYPKDEDFYNFFNSRNIDKYKRIIFVSNENKEGFIKKYKSLKDRCYVYNNFIDTSEIIKQSKEKVELKKNKKQIQLVYIGRLDETQKKISRQINLVKEIPEIDLWIVGDGPDKKEYEKLVKKYKLEKRITFFGRQSNPFPYMKNADYLLLTSDYEGFPVTYLEAITLGTGIITTFPTSDDKVDIKKIGNIISIDEKEMVKEVKEIIKKQNNSKTIDLDKVQEERLVKIQNMFEEINN